MFDNLINPQQHLLHVYFVERPSRYNCLKKNQLNTKYVEIKCQLDATDDFFIADLIACSTCFGHHYAHHQELKTIILLYTQPSAPHQTDNLKTKAPNITGSNHLYNTLELLMMGIMVPETC